MNFVKSPFTADDLAIVYSQVMIGMLSDAYDFELAIQERGEGESDFCIDLLPHVRALGYACHVLSDEIACHDLDINRDFYQAFGKHLISERAGDFLDITQSDSGCLEMLCDYIRNDAFEVDTLSRLIYADVFKRSYLAALPVAFDDLNTLNTCDVYAPFSSANGTTLTPLLMNEEHFHGCSIDPDDLDEVKAQFEYLDDESFENHIFFKLNDIWYCSADFMKIDHSIFGTVGSYGESAFSGLLLIQDEDAETFHIVRESN